MEKIFFILQLIIVEVGCPSRTSRWACGEAFVARRTSTPRRSFNATAVAGAEG